MAGRYGRGLTLAVGQSGGGTPVINASLAGVVSQAQRLGIRRILGMVHGLRGLLDEQFLDLSAQSPDALALLADTPSAALGLCRFKIDPDQADQVVAILRKWQVDAFLYIGGNDSAATTRSVAVAASDARYDLACLAIPKTIDNDLVVTDHTPGYGSAARLVASLSRDLALDAAAMRHEEQVRILEVYGRDTGWLAAASTLGQLQRDAPHIVLVPERPFDADHFLAGVERHVARAGYCTVVAGEMLRDRTGALVGSNRADHHDAFGHAETRRPGAFLRDLVQRRLGIRAKDDRPGSVQKVAGDLASTVDRAEAFALGQEAVRAVLAGQSDCMVTLERVADQPYACGYGRAPLTMVAGNVKALPEEYLDAQGQPTAAFRRYAIPLIGEPLPPRAVLTLPLAAAPCR